MCSKMFNQRAEGGVVDGKLDIILPLPNPVGIAVMGAITSGETSIEKCTESSTQVFWAECYFDFD